MKKLLMLTAFLALVLAACGGDSETTDELPLDSGAGADQPAAGACLEGEPDCNDTPGGEPTDLPAPGDDTGDAPQPAVIRPGEASAVSGPVSVEGFIIAVGGEIRLCEALAESFPPQCGEPSITLTSLDQVDPDDIQSSGDVRWTDFTVTIFGEMVGGTLVATPIE